MGWSEVRDRAKGIPIGYPLVGVLAVATTLRAIGVFRWSLWLDEIYSASLRSQQPLRELLYLPYDPHPPLYFLLVRLWTSLWDTGPVAVRSLSVLFSVAAVFGMFVLGRELYDERTGLVAAALFAVSPAQIHFGRNARMYSLFVLATIASTYFFLRLRDRDRRSNLLYVLSTIALLYTHVYGVFVVAGQNLYVLLRRRDLLDGLEIRRWLSLQVVVGLLFLPWAVVLGDQVASSVLGETGGAVAIGWIPEPSVGLLRNSLHMYAGSPWELYPVVTGNATTIPVVEFVLLGFLAASVIALFSWEDRLAANPETEAGRLRLRSEAVLLVALFLAIVGIPYLASMVLMPMYFPRFTVVATVPLFLLVANGIGRLRAPYGAVLLVLLVGSSLFLAVTYYEGATEEPWEEAVSTVEANTDGGDLVIVRPAYTEGYFQYYYDGSASIVGHSESASDSGDGEAGDGDSDSHVRSMLDDNSRVCVFRYGADTPPLTETLRAAGYETVDTFEQGVIRTACYADGT